MNLQELLAVGCGALGLWCWAIAAALSSGWLVAVPFGLAGGVVGGALGWLLGAAVRWCDAYADRHARNAPTVETAVGLALTVLAAVVLFTLLGLPLALRPLLP